VIIFDHYKQSSWQAEEPPGAAIQVQPTEASLRAGEQHWNPSCAISVRDSVHSQELWKMGIHIKAFSKTFLVLS
jgi:hypothetical protein